MRVFCAIAIAVTVSACGGPQPEFQEMQRLMTTKPSEWAASGFDGTYAAHRMAICNRYNDGHRAEASNPLRRIPMDAADRAAMERALTQAGLSSRDIELMRTGRMAYGTGQSFLGLSCSFGFVPRVNTSFYQGTGHQWQAVIPEARRYIYLRGDGTPEGMRVTSWN